ncbi:MAG TPA: ABC transporter substrate-binding protein [Thermoanaerobaculia bacterium]|nr:ABC transporter substrate-binding protein [Thermoanaerobaculia bacterium]
MRTVIAVVVAALAITVLSSAQVVTSATPQPIPSPGPRIGVILSLTGEAAKYGQAAKNGVDLAVREVNRSGGVGNRSVSVVLVDAESNPDVAAAALNRMANDGIQVVIGDVSSDCTLKLAPLAQQLHVLLMSPGASAPAISDAGDFVFRNWQSDVHEAKADANLAIDTLGWKKIAVVAIGSSYTEGISKAFKAAVKDDGASVTEFTYRPSERDFRSSIAVMRKQSFDGIFLVGYGGPLAAFLRQRSEAGLRTSILSVQAFDAPETLIPEAEGVIFSSTAAPNSSDANVRRFREHYRDAYHSEPTLCADSGYDAVGMIVSLLRRGTATSADMKQQLRQISYPGAAGRTEFDEHGDVPKEIVFRQIHNGRSVPMGPGGFGWTGVRNWATQQMRDLSAKAFAAIASAIGLAIVAALIRMKPRVREFLAWQILSRRFALRAAFSRRSAKIVTIDDYVHLLTRMRQRASRLRAIKGNGTSLVMQIYTRQIPRDWPLWERESDENESPKTPLEEYFFAFEDFIRREPIVLRRTIVIDASDSPRGRERLAMLKNDVESQYFKRYLERLHSSPADAYYYCHRDTWPNWLSDAVFFGLQVEGGIRWLWGVTTSYSSGDELILMRLHRLGVKKHSKDLPLPWRLDNLDDFALPPDRVMKKMLPLEELVAATLQ